MFSTITELESYLISKTAMLDEIYKFKISEEIRAIKEQDRLEYINSVIANKPLSNNNFGIVTFYMLGCTNIDPVKEKIPHRYSGQLIMPDIDTDFDSEGHHEIFKYLENKYGRGTTLPITTYVLLSGKNIIRDILRVLEHPLEYSNKLSKLVDDNDDFDMVIEKINKNIIKNTNKEFVKYWFANREKIKNIGSTIEGCIRQMSTHPAGNIILPPNTNSNHFGLPLQAARGQIQTAWQEGLVNRDLADMGFIKYDFLGLTALTIIKSCIKLIKENKGIDINIKNIGDSDKKIYKEFSKANTDFVFQFSSDAMKRILKESSSANMNELSACNALFRPGTLRFVDEFIDNKPFYSCKETKTILEDSRGILLYQEQLTKIFEVIGGFNKTNAEKARKISKTKDDKSQEWEETLNELRDHAKNVLNLSPNIIIGIINKIEDSKKYLFNKNHCFSYTYLAYVMMWFKLYYPVEFFSSIMIHDNDKDIANNALKELKRIGCNIKIGPIEESSYELKLNGNVVYMPLKLIKGLPEKSLKEFLARRPFNTYGDFVNAIKDSGLNRASYKTLCNMELFDSILLKDDLDLFSVEKNAKQIYKDIYKKEFPEQEEKNLNYEKEIFGFNISEHPIARLKSLFAEWGIVPISELEAKSGTVVFYVNKAIIKKSKKNTNFLKVYAEDEQRSHELFMFNPGPIIPQTIEKKLTIAVVTRNNFGFVINRIIKTL